MNKQTQNKVVYNLKDLELNKEEREMLKSVECGEWKTVANFDQELKFAQEAAKNSLCKDARIMSSTEL
ncbi:MAG: hypothetical protein M1561_04475 [Gammaproteobacteria bacterium]|nr:hypothetical protein [Gammaproteobacteria bacterium]